MKTYKWNLSDGREVTLEARYTATMGPRVVDADGQKVTVGEEIKQDGLLTAYIDGKKYDSSWNEQFWQVIDTQIKGIKRIWGIKGIGFTEERAVEIAAFLKDVIEEGTGDDVRAYLKKEEDKKIAKEVERAKQVIKKAEAQPDIPDSKEAQRRMRIYNEINNEGGYGYVPYIICREEYEDAKKTVSKYPNM